MSPDVLFVLTLYGSFVSWVQERNGSFEKLNPNQKQVINAVLTILVPIIVGFLLPMWGGSEQGLTEGVNAVLLVFAPVFIWLVSQVAHYVDKLLAKFTAR